MAARKTGYLRPRPLDLALGTASIAGASVHGFRVNHGFHVRHVPGAHLLQHFIEQRRLARIHLGRRRLLVTVIVIVVARPAANLGRLAVQHRNHRVVHDALAAHAKIVDIVAQARLAHENPPN